MEVKKRTIDIANSMHPAWYNQVIGPEKMSEEENVDNRSEAQRRFDNGVFAASEFVRRYTGNEDLAWQVLQMTHYNHPAFKVKDGQDRMSVELYRIRFTDVRRQTLFVRVSRDTGAIVSIPLAFSQWKGKQLEDLHNHLKSRKKYSCRRVWHPKRMVSNE